MTDTAFTAQDVADFLQNNPDFFDQHAEVFATLQVPHPHGARAISLGERQILTLRERNRELEWRLNELAHHADSNEAIGERVSQWCCRLLGEAEPQDRKSVGSGTSVSVGVDPGGRSISKKKK